MPTRSSGGLKYRSVFAWACALRDTGDVLADAHFAAREAIVTMVHPQLGDFPMQNVVPKLSDTPGEIRWVGPELGEHTDEVLAEVLDLSADDAARLRDAGVI